MIKTILKMKIKYNSNFIFFLLMIFIDRINLKDTILITNYKK